MNDKALRTAYELVDELLAQPPALVTYAELAEYKRQIRHLIAEDRERVGREARADELSLLRDYVVNKNVDSDDEGATYYFRIKERLAALTNKPKQNDQQ